MAIFGDSKQTQHPPYPLLLKPSHHVPVQLLSHPAPPPPFRNCPLAAPQRSRVLIGAFYEGQGEEGLGWAMGGWVREGADGYGLV